MKHLTCRLRPAPSHRPPAFDVSGSWAFLETEAKIVFAESAERMISQRAREPMLSQDILRPNPPKSVFKKSRGTAHYGPVHHTYLIASQLLPSKTTPGSLSFFFFLRPPTPSILFYSQCQNVSTIEHRSFIRTQR